MGGFESNGGAGLGGLPTPLPPILGGGGGGPSDCGTGQITAAIGGANSYTGAQALWLQQWARALFSAFVNSIKAIIGAIVSVFRYLQATWLGQIIKGIWAKLKVIWAAVQDEVKKILCVLEAYEALVRFYEQQLFAPLLALIQRLRKILVIFRVFHLHFATALDNYLLTVEGRIVTVELETQKKLNHLIDYLNLIVDPDGLLNQQMYIGAAAQSAAAIWSIFLTKKTAQTQDYATYYQTPAWANYNMTNGPTYATEILQGGPRGMEGYQLTQAKVAFHVLGAPDWPIGG
jgi:hypothetical protein